MTAPETVIAGNTQASITLPADVVAAVLARFGQRTLQIDESEIVAARDWSVCVTAWPSTDGDGWTLHCAGRTPTIPTPGRLLTAEDDVDRDVIEATRDWSEPLADGELTRLDGRR